MQKQRMWGTCLIMLGLLATGTVLRAQSETESTSPVYVCVFEWDVPRAQWADMSKRAEQTMAIDAKLLSEGTITAYGEMVSLIHTEGQPTHAEFFWTPTEGNVLKVLTGLMTRPDRTSPVVAASKHWDHILVSRIHNYRAGKFDGAYLIGSTWKVKPGQMKAFQALIKASIVPMLEKELAGGNVIFYSVDTEDYHTDVPGLVDVVFAVPDAAASDKVSNALEAALSQDKKFEPALAALTESDSHRDFLDRIIHMVIK